MKSQGAGVRPLGRGSSSDSAASIRAAPTQGAFRSVPPPHASCKSTEPASYGCLLVKHSARLLAHVSTYAMLPHRITNQNCLAPLSTAFFLENAAPLNCLGSAGLFGADHSSGLLCSAWGCCWPPCLLAGRLGSLSLVSLKVGIWAPGQPHTSVRERHGPKDSFRGERVCCICIQE